MQARTRFNLVLAVMCLALAGVVVVRAVQKHSGRVPGAVVFELGGAEIDSMEIVRRGKPPFAVERVSKDYRLKGITGPVKTTDVRALFDSMSLLSVRRRVEDGKVTGDVGLSPPRLTVTLTLSRGQPVVLEFGNEMPDVRGVWMRRRGQEGLLLVEAHVARDLDVEPATLRRRVLFDDTRLNQLSFDQTVLVGQDPPLVTVPLGKVRLSAEFAEDLRLALRALAIKEFSEVVDAAAPLHTLKLNDQTVTIHGACPGGTLVKARDMSGCVDEAVVARLLSLIDRLKTNQDVVDRHVFSFTPDKITVTHDQKDTVRSLDADNGDAVRDWLRMCDAEISSQPATAFAKTAPWMTLVAEASKRTETVQVFVDGDAMFLQRPGDTAAVRLLPTARAVFDSPDYVFLPRTLITRDSIDLKSFKARAGGRIVESVERGELLDDWKGSGPIDESSVEFLETEASRLTALKTVADKASAAYGPWRREVELHYDPPPDQPRSEIVTVRLGKKTARGCYATTSRKGLDSVVYELPERACKALTGPWTH